MKDIHCVSKHTCLKLCRLPTTIWAEVCFCHWGHDESKPGNSRPERSRQGSSSDTAKTCRDQMTGTMRENKQQWEEAIFSVLNFNPKYYFMDEIRNGMSSIVSKVSLHSDTSILSKWIVTVSAISFAYLTRQHIGKLFPSTDKLKKRFAI